MDSNVAASFSDEATSMMMPTEDSKYVKVHLVGQPIGRKINLKAHDNYESLAQALHNMFDNFFSVDYSSETKENPGEPNEFRPKKHLLFIYEDNEGDHILVGDVPWTMFIDSVKRLYIVSRPKNSTSAAPTPAQAPPTPTSAPTVATQAPAPTTEKEDA